MKKLFLITALFFIIPGSLGYEIGTSGQIYGNGYTAEGQINLSSGTYASDVIENSGYNYIQVNGDIAKDLKLKIQGSKDSFNTIDQEKVFVLNKSDKENYEITFPELEGDQIRIVIETENPIVIDSIMLEKKSITSTPLFWIQAIIIILGLSVVYIGYKWRTKR